MAVFSGEFSSSKIVFKLGLCSTSATTLLMLLPLVTRLALLLSMALLVPRLPLPLPLELPRLVLDVPARVTACVQTVA